jgi:hypothetical protein
MIRTSLLIILSLVISSKSFSQAEVNPDTAMGIFEKVDVEASFPGGVKAWRTFLERNLNASAPVDNGAPSGQYLIFVQFIVNKDGSVSNIKPLTRLGYGMEEEVVRIIGKSGSWIPAMQNGKPVKAYRKQPVTFMTSEEGFNILSKTPYVIYAETDNELTIELDDVKAENLEVIISEGTITNMGEGKFIARVSKPGRVTITVFNKKKKNKAGTEMSFEVRLPKT